MLNRQKIILTMLREYGEPASRLQLTKWLFLLAYESPSRGGNAFYQFVPYKYGPYSFTLFQEANTLLRNGYIETVGHQKWGLTKEGQTCSLQLPAVVHRNCREIVQLYGKYHARELVDIVYRRYPWFTLKAKWETSRVVSRPTASNAIYTMGYEGFLIDGFVNELLGYGIQRVLDVRHNPTSRRYGFHKSTLSRISLHLDLEYEHFPEVGVPAEYRSKLVEAKDYQTLFAHYELTTLAATDETVQRLAAMLVEKPSVLICLEADPAMCHRSRLADAIAIRAQLPVKHLGWPR